MYNGKTFNSVEIKVNPLIARIRLLCGVLPSVDGLRLPALLQPSYTCASHFPVPVQREQQHWYL